ncbi:glycosyltransferase family 2 protein [Caulobacter sp. 17J65-9]|uniref:glycosyltransferase family 2 protein n=1 Tax=Caulobacter sp. 17J65-9 TaxID=2709382 RepID=UPI0013CA5290|nr:glycosyltransferase family 2 protein [Caulobacter sp. 17J65-9]NEX91554.1 glycosyltransferase family 2 protein [Caulobacter sp. 17J65-9]
MSRDVAVLIPTLRRPDSLARAVRSLIGQAPNRLREIVVADNDPAGSARATVEALATEASVPVIYVHAPRPGVATARNAALTATEAPLIAFLDDDEEAAPGWLAALLDTHERFGADVTFGAIHGRAPDAKPWLRPYLEDFFSRRGPEAAGLVAEPYGCGCSLMTRAVALPGPAPFDTSADQSGGEDDKLFAGLAARGGRFAWAPGALAFEHAPAHRATLGYALKRAFAYGQGPSQTCAHARDWAGVLKWSAVGAAQACAWSALALVLWIARRPTRAQALDRAARGLGKLFWFNGLEPQLYGAAELRRTAASA